jgi:hypothetical protein
LTENDLEAEAVRAVLDALAVVRRYRLAEVEIVITSDRAGAVHLRHHVKVPLPALAEEGLDSSR